MQRTVISTLSHWPPRCRMPGGNYMLIYKLGTIIRDCMIIFINDLKSGYNQDRRVLQGQTAELEQTFLFLISQLLNLNDC